MPLDEIARVLSLADRPAEVKAILDGHRRRLEIDLARQQRMLEFLERLMTRESIMPYEVTVKNVDPLLALATRKKSTTATVAADVQDAFGSLMQVIMSGAVQVVGAPFIVFLEIVDDTGGEMEVCVPVAASADVANGLYMTEIPGGMVASTIHQGPYAEVGPAHHVVAGWIQEHGHQPAGPPREVYLNDPTQVSEDEQLTEVIWPITD